MTTTYAVRRAGVESAAGITRVQIAGWRGAYRGLVASHVLEEMDETTGTSDWAHRLALATSVVFVAVTADASDEVIGFCDVGPSRDTGIENAGHAVAGISDGALVAELYAFYVAREAQRRGVGTALAHAALEWARVARFRGVTVWTIDQNWPAHAFYRSLGFETDGADKVDIIGGQPVRDVRFARSL